MWKRRVRDGDKPYKPVYVHLDGASLPKALRTIARSAGAKVSKNDDGVYVFEPESEAAGSDMPIAPASPSPTFQTAAAQPADNRPESKYPPGSLHWYSIVLQHAVPSDILKMMRWDQDLVEMTPFQPAEVPQPKPSIYTAPSGLILPTNVPGYPNGYQNGGSQTNGYQNGGDPSVPIGTGNGGPAGANYSAHRSPEPNSPNQANQFPFPGGGGNPFGGGGNPFGGGGNPFGGGGNPFGGGGNPFGGGGNPFGGGGNPFGGGGVNPFGGNGQNGRGAALPDGVVRIFALQANNSLLVEASNPGAIAELRRIIKFLDVAPRQVQVKVEFVTASVVDVDNLGFNFDLVPYPGLELATTQGSGTYGGTTTSTSPTFLQYATGNIVAQLFQTLVRTRGKVVQAPIITTTNNVPAFINILTSIPFFTTQTTVTGGLTGNTFNNTQANVQQLSTNLAITPRINSDDSITMNLSPTITDVTGQPAVNGVFPTVQQTVNTLRTVRSGDTMVLGGLVRKQETSSSQRIPILSDIPYLGGLFRTRNKQINDSELLIFVTPTIISDTNDSATANANAGQSVTVSP